MYKFRAGERGGNSMRYNFDQIIDRHNTYSTQWDYTKDRFGSDDVLPFSISDTDFQVPNEILDSMNKRLEHPIFGYTRWNHQDYKNSIIQWFEDDGITKVDEDWIVYSPSVVYTIGTLIRELTDEGDGVARHTSFCTDDVTAHDILEKGHLDHMVRLAIQHGVDPMTAIQMATLNGAEAYHIEDQVGSIAPGKDADILLIDRPESFNVKTVISKGTMVFEDGVEKIDFIPTARSQTIQKSIKLTSVSKNNFEYQVDQQDGTVKVRTIKSVGPFVRKAKDVDLNVRNGIILPSVEKDVALVSVIERYGINGNHSKGFISGWGLKSGAIATSASPDDNNIVVAGTNSEDMALAVNELIRQGGGQIVVDNGKIISFLQLPIGGIVTDLEPRTLAKKEIELKEAANQLGCELPDPLFYLSFLPITAIPDLAITDGGNVDYRELKYFDPILK